MARTGYMGSGLRIIALLLLVLVLAVGGLIWFDFLSLVDAGSLVAPVRKALGLQPGPEAAQLEDPLLLETERLTKQQEQLDLRREELDRREEQLQERTAQVTQMQERLEERELALEEREKSFNERRNAFENRRVNLEQNARYLVGMPPARAVDLLMAMEDDMDVIDILRMTEENARESGELSLVAYWLSLMPPERSATLVRKMARPSVP